MLSKFLATCCVALAASCAAPAFAATPSDALTQEVLAKPLHRFDDGGQDAAAIHRNLPQYIEQNIARLDAAGASRLVDNLSDREWRDMAIVYGRAAVDAGHSPRLLPLLASRVGAERLARLGSFFGNDAVMSAVQAQAPQKVLALQVEMSLAGGASTMALVGPSYWLDYTPTEIYLDLRTMPYGSLSVNAALLETGVTLFLNAGAAYTVGYSIGTVFAGLIQTYAPSLWTAIGGTVDAAMQNIQTATTQLLQGQYESAAGSLFGLSGTESTGMKAGGDDGVTDAWAAWAAANCGTKCTKNKPN